MIKIDENKLRTELEQFTGTEKYYCNPSFPEHKYTDGVKHFAERVEAYWFVEFIFCYSEIPVLEEAFFQVWKLQVQENGSVIISVEDGNDSVLKSFKIPFTDFPMQSIDLWLVDSVLILPSEY